MRDPIPCEGLGPRILKRSPSAVSDLPLFEPTYDGRLDGPRLTSLLYAVRSLMQDGRWRSLGEIHAVVGHSEAGISARLRELRNHWGCIVERKRMGTSGLWLYRVASR